MDETISDTLRPQVSAGGLAEQATGRPPYVLIVGNGRSGTNFLLNLLDLSPLTHCRNEPDAPQCKSMAELPQDTSLFGPQPDDFGERWDRAVQQAHHTTGLRDPMPQSRKHYYRAGVYPLGLCRLLHSRPFITRFRRVLPPYEGEEATLPGLLYSLQALNYCLPVLKVNYVPGWVEWLVEHRPQVQLAHIIRHPGGFLRSWRNRWLGRVDERELLATNHERLRQIAARYPRWGKQFGEIDRLCVDATELWFWRYVNEQLHTVGRVSPRYHRIIYEQLTADPLTITEQLYQACGLSWNEAIADSVREHTSHSQKIAGAWRRDLSDEQIALVEQILAGSLMRDWWRE